MKQHNHPDPEIGTTSATCAVDIESLRSRKFGSYTHKYTQRDLILYALGAGCRVDKVGMPGGLIATMHMLTYKLVARCKLAALLEVLRPSGQTARYSITGGYELHSLFRMRGKKNSTKSRQFRQWQDLPLLYEGHPHFAPLPTYAIIAAHPALALIPLEAHIPGFTRAHALHGEHTLRVTGRLPPRGTLVTTSSLVDVRDKGRGKGVVVVVRTVTCDAATGREVAVNEFVAYGLRGGGFGSPWAPAPRDAASTEDNAPPPSPPDKEAEEAVTEDQAALYRLSGDMNPLHIDPGAANKVGYPRPILHGLCTLAVSVRRVVGAWAGGDHGRLRAVKVRFTKHVFPGETLCVRMWGQGVGDDGLRKVVFETVVVGRNVAAISSAAVYLANTPFPSSPGGGSRENTFAKL